jgi:hypothetical protein
MREPRFPLYGRSHVSKQGKKAKVRSLEIELWPAGEANKALPDHAISSVLNLYPVTYNVTEKSLTRYTISSIFFKKAACSRLD